MRSFNASQAAFAVTLIALGAGSFVTQDFAAIWQPVSKTFPAREALVHGTALIAAACGIAWWWRRTASAASGVLSLVLAIWLLVFKARFIVNAPLTAVSYETCGETVVLVAGAWTVYASLAAPLAGWRGYFRGDRARRIARVLYGLALIAFGVAHFAYLAQTAALVPAWLPAHEAWAIVTGITYVAAGGAVLGGVQAPRAAALAALQMAGFTLLVWVPPLFAGPSADQLSEFAVSFTMTIAGWVIADSYRRDAGTEQAAPLS